MNPSKKKSWKGLLVVLCLLGSIGIWLCFGERGLIHLYRTEMERQTHIEKIRQLAAENQALLEEVQRLKTDMEYVESVARKELNLIKKNEVIYRFDEEASAPDTAKSSQLNLSPREKKCASEKEEQRHENN